jgi:SAM-dependent methyltransferase
MDKPFSQACENNKQAILTILSDALAQTKLVVEIGSGTGQHAAFFGKNLPHLTWQTSDLAINHPGINAWLMEMPANNVKNPIVIDMNEPAAIAQYKFNVDAIFTANTLHIMSWPLVVKFFQAIAESLPSKGVVCIYGPFKYNGEFTSESNADFDLRLKDRDINSGVRDFEAVLALAKEAELTLINDHKMPANNQLLVFNKK